MLRRSNNFGRQSLTIRDKGTMLSPPLRATNYLGKEIPKKRRSSQDCRSNSTVDMPSSSLKPATELLERTKSVSKTDENGLTFVDIPYVVATDETLQGFGRLTNSIDRTAVELSRWPAEHRAVTKGNCAGMVSGPLISAWKEETGDLHTENVSVNKKYHIGFKKGEDVFTWYTNYHPDGSQIFQNPSGEPFMVIMAPRCGDFEIHPSAHIAFYVPGDQAITIDSGVWHQAVFPLTLNSMTLTVKQGRVRGVVTFDAKKEFGVHLRVKNAFKRPEDSVLPPNFPLVKPLNDVLDFVQNKVLIDVVKASASKNDQSQYFVDVPLKLATPGSIHGFGHLFTNFDYEKVVIETWPSRGRPVEHGNQGGQVSKSPWTKWEGDKGILVTDPSEGGLHLETAFKAGHHLYVSQIERRLDSNHVIRPCYERPFVLLLSKHLSEPQIKPNDFVAFYFEGNCGISIDQGIWRSVALPVSQVMKWDEKHGAVNATVKVEFAKEFGVFIRVKDFSTRPRY